MTKNILFLSWLLFLGLVSACGGESEGTTQTDDTTESDTGAADTKEPDATAGQDDVAADVPEDERGDEASEDTMAADTADVAAEDAHLDDTMAADGVDATDEDMSATAAIEALPALGEWTPDYTPLTDCSCDGSQPECYAIFVGRVINIDGNIATMEFKKTPDGAPSVPVSYWVVVSEAATPSCVDTNSYVERVSGVWDGGVLQVVVPLWPDEAAFEQAGLGETKNVFVITGGGDGPDTRRWFQKQAVTFEKVSL